MTSQGSGSKPFTGTLLIGSGTVTSVDQFRAMITDAVRYTSADLIPTVGSSLITVSTPGWYRVTAMAQLVVTSGESTDYSMLEGDNAAYVHSTGFTAYAPYPKSSISEQGLTILGIGYYEFNATFKTMELQLRNPGSLDQEFSYWTAMELLFSQ